MKIANTNDLYPLIFPTKYNLCIEFDNQQHFREGIGGKIGKYVFTLKDWEKLSMRDAIKSQWYDRKNIRLIRIAYNQQD
jgi:hypothetical protein